MSDINDLHIDGPALIVLALVCANVRNCSQPSSRLRALDVFLALSVHLTDEAKLDRLVPYIVDLLRDDVAVVRAAALRTLLQVVSILVYMRIRKLSTTKVVTCERHNSWQRIDFS